MSTKILIAVAWPYVNGDLHVGHLAGYLVPADIMARFHRIYGNDVLMVSGADCHGTPITIEADKSGKTPSEIVDFYHKKDIDLFKKYNLSYNLYTKTTTANHAKVVQNLFMKLLTHGFIDKGTEKQFFSESDNKFLPDRYVEGTCPYCRAEEQRSDQCENCGRMIEQGAILNPKSKLTGSPVSLKDTEHYYLNLSKLQDEVKDYLQDKDDVWRNWVYKEAQGWLKEGLKPRAITRDLDWGVEIPFERIKEEFPEKMLDRVEGKKFYVWFDAVIGYLSAAIEFSERFSQENSTEDVIFNKFQGQSGNWKEWWENSDSYHYYFMGQDNVVFHTIMWPAQLLGSDKNLHLPDNVFANKFMNYEGKKFSKSRGHIIDSNEIADKFGVDAVRFYVSANLPENKVGNFTWDEFMVSINNELVANLGNLINRTLVFFYKSFNSEISGLESDIDDDVKNKISEVYTKTAELINSGKLTEALNEIMSFSAFGNKYFNDSEIWKVIKEDQAKAKTLMFNMLQIVINLTTLIEPFMPESSRSLRESFGFERIEPVVGENKWTAKFVHDIKLVKVLKPLFKKIEEEDLPKDEPKIQNKFTINDVKNLLEPVKIVEVLRVEKHPNADRLFVVEVTDKTNNSQVVTGADNVCAGDLVAYLGVGGIVPGALLKKGKEIKLELKSLRGVESHGMILAEDEIGLSDNHENVLVLQTEKEKIGSSILEILTEEELSKILK